MRKFITALAAFALLAALGGAVPASSDQAKPKLKLVAVGNAEIGWAIGPDSPLDKGRSALNMAINGPTQSGYTNAYNNKWLTKDDGGLTSIPIANIRNLSFDFLNAAGGGYVGGGAPRISIVFTNGLVAYLSAVYCDTVIPGSAGTWSRADFTGQKATGCRFYDSAAGIWDSTGTQSAWDVFAAAHPLLKADYGVVVQDESDSGPMRARIDRIAMQNYMQENAGRVVKCPLETSC